MASDTGEPPGRLVPFAGTWQRLFAFLIDFVIVSLSAVFLAFVLEGRLISQGAVRKEDIVTTCAALGLAVAYKVTLETSKYQATFGKMLFGIKVVDLSGNRISVSDAAIRAIPMYLPFVALVLDAAVRAIVDESWDLMTNFGAVHIFLAHGPMGLTKRGFHDRAAGSLVVFRDTKHIPPPIPLKFEKV
ncbi:MAG: RDD family protein [Rhodospirillaceae bacterium]